MITKRCPFPPHVSFQKEVKEVESYVGISRVCFFKGGERTNVPKSVEEGLVISNEKKERS